MQVYQARAAQLKVQYEADYQKFLQGIGGKKKQAKYLESLSQYKADKRAYLKQFRLRKQNLIEVCVSLGMYCVRNALA